MVDVYVPKQVVEELKKSKLRIEMKDNVARACSAIVQLGGKKVFYGKYARVPFETFGIRRNSTKGTLDWLIKKKFVKSDEQASHPKMPRIKRKNKGPNRSNGFRFSGVISESDLIPYTLRPRKAGTKKRKVVVSPTPTVDCRGPLTATQQLIAQKMLQFDVNCQALRHAIHAPGVSVVERVQMEFLAARMQQKQFYAKSASTGRLITSLNSCSKVLRAALSVNGEEMAELDAGCCNPLLLCFLMRNSCSVSENDLAAFQGWTETGRLYDVIAEDLRTDRDTVKKSILAYFCGAHEFCLSRLQRKLKWYAPSDRWAVVNEFLKRREIAAWFRSTLPSIDRFLADWKMPKEGHWKAEYARQKKLGGRARGAHAIVSRTLQKLESELIIENCCTAIFANYPEAVLTTIHDSLFLPASLINVAKGELRRSFASKGLSPKIKVTPVILPAYVKAQTNRTAKSTNINKNTVFTSL